MGSSYLTNPLEFLISIIFGLYILAVMLRFLFQLVHADFFNPLSQFLVKITNPPLRPLRRFIPGWHGLDFAAIVLMLVLQMLSLTFIILLRGAVPSPFVLLIWSVAELLTLVINVFLFALVVQVILSWVNPGLYNPVTGILHSLNEPLLRPARRLIPPFSGIDLSPLVVLVALQLLKMLLIPPLMSLLR